jgi:transcriptional regulator with XRE-family HTH domain
MNLKIARQIAHLTQRQLARRAGVDEATISLLERGERDYAQAGYAAIVRLARALGVETELLFPVPDQTRLEKTEQSATR